MAKKFKPIPVGDRAAFIRKAAVATSIVDVPTYQIITYSVARGLVEAAHVPVSEVSDDANTKGQWYVDGGHTMSGPDGLAKTHLSWLKSQALRGGATPDAIRLLDEALGLTKKEKEDMAKAAKTAKLAKKSDTPAPVGKGGKAAEAAEGTKRRGNPEALKKAREARAEAGPDIRKIKIVNKENPYRADSNRAASFDALKGAKTVEDYKNAGGKTKYLSRWAEEGRITLG